MGSLWTRVPCSRNEPFPCEPNLAPGPHARGDQSHLPIVIVCHSNHLTKARPPGRKGSRVRVIERKAGHESLVSCELVLLAG